MPVSHLTNSVAEILAFGLNEATGGSYSHLTTSEDQMLALLVSEMTGQEYSHLTTSRETLWELLLTQAASDGITFDRLTQSNEQIAAIIANNVAAGEEYEGPLDLVSGAAWAGSASRALSADMLGQPLFTVLLVNDSSTQVFNADAVTGEVDSAAVATFVGDGDPIETTGATDISTSTIVVADATGIEVGQIVSGSNIKADTTVIEVSGLNVITSARPDSTLGSVALTFTQTALVSVLNDHTASANDGVGFLTAADRPPVFLANQYGAKPAFSFLKSSRRHWTTPDPVSLPNGAFTIFVVNTLLPAAGVSETTYPLCGMNYQTQAEPGEFMDFSYVNADTTTSRVGFDSTSDSYGTNECGGITTAKVGGYDGVAQITELAADASTLIMAVNGAEQTIFQNWNTGTVGSISQRLGIGINDIDDDTFGGECFSGLIAEIILYPTLLTPEQRTTIRQNMATYYGITLP